MTHIIDGNPINESDPLQTADATARATLASILARLPAGGAATEATLADIETLLAGGLPAVLTAGGGLKVGLVDEVPAGTKNIGKVDPVVSTPAIYTVTMTLANTEYSQALPANCRRFEFQCRGSYDVRFAFVTGKVAGPTEPYMTLKAGRSYDSGSINQGASPSTLYVACATAAQVVEILAWT